MALPLIGLLAVVMILTTVKNVVNDKNDFIFDKHIKIYYNGMSGAENYMAINGSIDSIKLDNFKKYMENNNFNDIMELSYFSKEFIGNFVSNLGSKIVNYDKLSIKLDYRSNNVYEFSKPLFDSIIDKNNLNSTNNHIIQNYHNQLKLINFGRFYFTIFIKQNDQFKLIIMNIEKIGLTTTLVYYDYFYIIFKQ